MSHIKGGEKRLIKFEANFLLSTSLNFLDISSSSVLIYFNILFKDETLIKNVVVIENFHEQHCFLIKT